MVDDPIFRFFLQFVLGFNKILSKRTPGFDGGAEALRVEESGERFSNASEEWKADIAEANLGCGGGGACCGASGGGASSGRY